MQSGVKRRERPGEKGAMAMPAPDAAATPTSPGTHRRRSNAARHGGAPSVGKHAVLCDAPAAKRARQTEDSSPLGDDPAASPLAATSVNAGGGWRPPTRVCIKVSDGAYLWFKHADLMNMDRGALLEAVADSRSFGDSMKGVPLDRCTVGIVPGAFGDDDKEEPDTADEVSAVELKATKTVGKIAREHCKGNLLFIHVRTPAKESESPVRLLTLEDDPHGMKFYGLLPDMLLTAFYAAVLRSEPQTADAAHGARLWRLDDTSDTSPARAAPIPWPMLEQQVLLERDFYGRFFSSDKWLASLKGVNRKFLVLGQPGIGKSSFGLWLLAQLLRSDRTVVYSRASAKPGTSTSVKHYVFHRRAAFEVVNPGGDKNLLQTKSVVHICDGYKPALGDTCYQIVVTSPDPKVWRIFAEKEGAIKLFFPLYSLEELEALRAAEYGETLSKHVVALRELAWGPVPRQVFASTQAEVKSSIQQALRSMTLESLQKAMDDVDGSTTQSADHIPHSFFLLHADRETFKPSGVTFRSQAIADRLMCELSRRQGTALLKALQRLLDSGSTRSLAGKLFEVAALYRLQRGGTFQIRPLVFVKDNVRRPATARAASMSSTESLESLELPAPTLSLPFKKLADVRDGCRAGTWALETHRFVPASSNFASIDSIERGLRLTQVTVTRACHELKVTSGRSEDEGLAAVARELLPLLSPPQPYLEVYFVVPTMAALVAFKPQALTFHDESSARKGKEKPATGPEAVRIPDDPEAPYYQLGFWLKDKLVEVRQYALLVPLDDRSGESDMPPRDVIDEAAET